MDELQIKSSNSINQKKNWNVLLDNEGQFERRVRYMTSNKQFRPTSNRASIRLRPYRSIVLRTIDRTRIRNQKELALTF